MIRPFTCLCLLIAAGSGLYLYGAKHDAQLLDRQIDHLRSQARSSRSDAGLLHAEYDRLGDPDRLRELATQVLTLQKTDPKQFVALADLEKRLPPVGLPPPPPAAPTVVELPVMAAVAPVVAAPVVASVAAPVAKPVQVAALENPAPVAAARPLPPAPRTLMTVAQAAPSPAPVAAPVAPVHAALPKPTSLAPQTVAQQQAPTPRPNVQMVAQVRQAPAQPQMQQAPAPQPRPAYVGSSLGMARNSNLTNPIGYHPISLNSAGQ